MKKLATAVGVTVILIGGKFGWDLFQHHLAGKTAAERVTQVLDSVAGGARDEAGISYYGHMLRNPEDRADGLGRWLASTALHAGMTWQIDSITHSPKAALTRAAITIDGREHTLVVPWGQPMYFLEE